MPRKDPEVCQKIRDRVDKWEKYWTINRSLYYEWIDFVMGDQWREDESKLFERYNKIPLMNNKLGVLMNHLVGDFIHNTPNLQVTPEENVDVRTADVRAALVKQISLNSDAKSVYQQTFWQAAVGGYSAYRVYNDYLNDFTMDQELLVAAFDDPNRCYWDVSAQTLCKTDGMSGGYKTRVSRKKVRDQYGKDVESQIGTIAVTEDSTMAFADDDSITLVDDFEREAEKGMIYQLSDKSIIDDKEYISLEKIKMEGRKGKVLIHNGQMVTVLAKREVVRYKVKHRQIAGDFIIKEEYAPFEQIPVVFVDMMSYYTKQGQQITRSFFKDAKDPQKYLNYLATQSAYIMKVSRYDQFMAPRKCVSAPDTAAQWRDPSVVRGALVYDETPSGAKPEKLDPPVLSRSLTEEYQRTLIDIQSGTGMYNTQMGEMGNEISGSAIEKRTQRGTKNTAVIFNSIYKAVAVGGELINEAIPKVYDTERQLMLSLPETESAPIDINKPVDPYGLMIENDMTKGRYKIRLKPGPSYEGQKDEALQSLQLVLQADKSGQVFPMIADLYAENLPLDNNIEIRNRLRTMVPPEIIEAGKTGKPLPPKQPQPSPEEMMIQLKQAELEHKKQEAQLKYEMEAKNIQHKEAELQRKAIETHQDMTMEWEKLEADKQQAAAKLQETMLRYEAETRRIGADLHMSETENIIKLLTHHSKKPEDKK